MLNDFRTRTRRFLNARKRPTSLLRTSYYPKNVHNNRMTRVGHFGGMDMYKTKYSTYYIWHCGAPRNLYTLRFVVYENVICVSRPNIGFGYLHHVYTRNTYMRYYTPVLYYSCNILSHIRRY